MVHFKSDFKIHHNHKIKSLVTFTEPLSILQLGYSISTTLLHLHSWLPLITIRYLSFPYFITFPYLSFPFITFPYLSFPFFSFAKLSLPFLILLLIVKLTNWLTSYITGTISLELYRSNTDRFFSIFLILIFFLVQTNSYYPTKYGTTIRWAHFAFFAWFQKKVM